MEVRVVQARNDVGQALVAPAERVVMVAAALDEFADVPLQVRRRRGAVVHVHEAAAPERGHHEEGAVDHRLLRDELVDRPRPDDHRRGTGGDDAGTQGTGDDVEIAADDGHALRQPGLRGRFGAHRASDVHGVDHRWEEMVESVQAVEPEEVVVERHSGIRNRPAPDMSEMSLTLRPVSLNVM